MDYVGYGLMALFAATAGTLGGLGGAILLVPALVVTGMAPTDAAPLGLLVVAAGSIAAAPRQLEERAVNHRIAVTTELLAASAAVLGALISGQVSERLLTYLLAAVAAIAALAGSRRRGMRNPPDPDCLPEDVGERVGSLAGAYPLGMAVVPYRPRHLLAGMSLMSVAAFLAGTIGAAGGFIKTPATTEVMGVPIKVAAATTTFTVGITASVALVVFAVQGRIDLDPAAFVIGGSLLGGIVGSRLQAAMRPALVRRMLSVLLVAVAVILVVRA